MTFRTKTRWLTARPALLVSSVPSIPPSHQIVRLVVTEALMVGWIKAAALPVPQETTALSSPLRQPIAQLVRTIPALVAQQIQAVLLVQLVSSVPSPLPLPRSARLVATEALKEGWTKAAALCVPQETTALWGL